MLETDRQLILAALADTPWLDGFARGLTDDLVREGLVDEFLVYQAPKLLGAGQPLASFGPLTRLEDALALRFVSVEHLGNDLRLIARPPGREHF